MKRQNTSKNMPKRNEQCPCGSGKHFGKCCAGQKFSWVKGEDGTWTQSIPMHPEAVKIIIEQGREFAELFGRKMQEDEYVFFELEALSSEELIEDEWSQVLEKAEIRPEIAYASKKTGLIVTEFNRSLLTGRDLQEWNDAIDEYHRTKVKEELTAEEKRIAGILELVLKEFDRCTVVMGTILRRGGPLRVTQEQELASGHSLFCLAKALKSMRALRLLTDEKFGEDGLILVRSILEAYLHIAYLQKYPEKAHDMLIARIGIEAGTHAYKVTSKGRIDYNCILEKATGKLFEGRISFKTMATGSGISEDNDVYAVLYDFLSGYSHPNIARSSTYLSQEAPSFDHTRQSMFVEARALGTIVGNMIVHLFFHSQYLSERMTNDLHYYLGRTRRKLLELLNSGFPNILLPAVLARIQRFPE